MDGIIHKTNAEDYLRSARIITGELAREAEQVTNYLSREQWLAEANAQAQIAQAEATLYAAEQQRIANKIAVALVEQVGALAETNTQPGYPMSPTVPIREYVTDDEWEGLGL